MSDYELGENVTELAKSVTDKKSVILSLRINQVDFEHLCRIAEQEDRSVSYVARRALLDGLLVDLNIPSPTTSGTRMEIIGESVIRSVESG